MSTSTAPFSEDIIVLEERRAVTLRQQNGQQRPQAKGLIVVEVEFHTVWFLHPRMQSQYLRLLLEKRVDSKVLSKMPASPHSTNGVLLRWRPGTATAH